MSFPTPFLRTPSSAGRWTTAERAAALVFVRDAKLAVRTRDVVVCLAAWLVRAASVCQRGIAALNGGGRCVRRQSKRMTARPSTVMPIVRCAFATGGE